VDELGGGAMGVVFRGRDSALDRSVAIKVLRPEAATAVAAERFVREARLLARLQNPHVVQVHQAGESSGLFYFVMDLVEGESLARRLERGPLPTGDALRLADDLLDALSAAHQLGIVHRDIKPSNTFLGPNGARLGDFGIARGAGGEDRDTLTGDRGLLGTPAYMAPEQVGGQNVTAAADLYAVGLILYECLTGRRWPRFADPAAADWGQVPRTVIPSLKRALALNPAERWPSAEAFRAGLTARPSRRRLLGLAAAVAVAALGVRALAGPGAPSVDLWGPGGAGPQSGPGQRAFEGAEALYRRGVWDSAQIAFIAAIAADSTCLICDFRLTDLDRWLEHPPDRQRLERLYQARGRFPEHYRELIEADGLTGRARIERLAETAQRYRQFPLAQYLYGAELFNRGPLFGRPREDAIASLQEAIRLDPGFAAPWFDLALAQVASGHAAGAEVALRHIDSLAPREGLSLAQHAMAMVAFACRFLKECVPAFERATQKPDVVRLPYLGAGPRVLSGLGTPAGAVALGQRYERDSDVSLRRSGLVAQIVGHAALGQVEQVRNVTDRLDVDNLRPAWRLFGVQVEAALLLEDDAAPAEAVRDVARRLTVFTTVGSDAAIRHRAAWMLALIRRRQGDSLGALAAEALLADEPEPKASSRLLAAWARSDAGMPDSALMATGNLVGDVSGWDAADQDPMLRAMLRLARAAWMERAGNSAAAVREYLWHEHFHLPRYPTAEPVPADGDWALGTLAEWRQARLLDQGQPGAEVCESYREVAERWKQGDGRFRARADTAVARLQALGCEASP
jgi:tetratricopeptide (TPR) repeat protein